MNAAQLREAIQDHWRVDSSTVSALWASSIATEIQAAQVGTMEGSNWPAVGKARVRRFLDSLHRGIRAIVQSEGGHIPYKRRY